MDTESYSVFIFSEILNLIIGLTCFLKLVVGTLTPFFQLLSFFVYLLSVCIFHPFLASWCFTKIYRNSSYGIKYNTSCLKCIIILPIYIILLIQYSQNLEEKFSIISGHLSLCTPPSYYFNSCKVSFFGEILITVELGDG